MVQGTMPVSCPYIFAFSNRFCYILFSQSDGIRQALTMISTSGNKLLQDDAIDIIVRELFKRTSLVTPNIDFDCIDGNIFKNRIQLAFQDFRRDGLYASDTLCVLGRNGGDYGSSVNSQC